MKQVDLWLPEDVTIDDGEGNIYSGITHIESGADGYAETFDGEVLLFSDIVTRGLSPCVQFVVKENRAQSEYSPRFIAAPRLAGDS